MRRDDILKKTILTNLPCYYTTDDICEKLIMNAKLFGVDEVLLGPSSVKTAKKLAGLGVKTGVGIAYPSGAVPPELKASEIRDHETEHGAADAYYVTAALGWFMSGHADSLRAEMEQCAAATQSPVYFFMEAAEMSDADIREFCEIAKAAGVAGVVGSNGFAAYDIKRTGAHDIARVKKYADGLCVLACGQMDTIEAIDAVISAGADKVLLTDADAAIF